MVCINHYLFSFVLICLCVGSIRMGALEDVFKDSDFFRYTFCGEYTTQMSHHCLTCCGTTEKCKDEEIKNKLDEMVKCVGEIFPETVSIFEAKKKHPRDLCKCKDLALVLAKKVAKEHKAKAAKAALVCYPKMIFTKYSLCEPKEDREEREEQEKQ